MTTAHTEASPATVRKAASGKKPYLAYLLATSFGLGYLPKAPGTWGSVAGLLLSAALLKLWPHVGFWHALAGSATTIPFAVPAVAAFLVIAIAGVWSANQIAAYTGVEDPQYVVIDEVSGQMLTLLAGIITSLSYREGMNAFAGSFWWHGSLNWKWLFLGFILFRVFDIWKPFPVRRLEKLPGGWGIMADDWMAGAYAAAVLRIALHLGLL